MNEILASLCLLKNLRTVCIISIFLIWLEKWQEVLVVVTCSGFSQYVDSLFSKKKEYPVYSKLPRTIKGLSL